MRVYLLLLASCLTFQLVLTATAQQDLDRVNDLVNQARGLADSLNARGIPTSPAVPINPFARHSSSEQGQSRTPPRVGIHDSNIQIDVNGRSLNIPRHNLSSLIYREGPPAGGGFSLPGNGGQYKAPIPAKAVGYMKLAEATSSFRAGNYEQSLATMNSAIQASPNDTRLHPFFAQVLFANGQYDRAAEFAYSAAATNQHWNWDDIRGLYGNPNAYSELYRQLQIAARDPQSSSSVHFLLGYHHFMLGHMEHARSEFQSLQTSLSNDPVVTSLIAKTSDANLLPPNPIQ